MRPFTAGRLRVAAMIARAIDTGELQGALPVGVAKSIGRRDLGVDRRVAPTIDSPQVGNLAAMAPGMVGCDECGELVDEEQAILLNNIGTACSDRCAILLQRSADTGR